MKRSAFTLLELLVVIAVISLLASLLLVAVNRGRETARRTQCISQQRELTKALIAYDIANNGLPGYFNQLVPAQPIHSWAVAIFPMIGEIQRYNALMGDPPPDEALVSPATLLCPSNRKPNPPNGESPLAYVVNCGPVGGDNARELTLFRDRRSELTSINTKVKIEDIPGGASNTILLSENLNAGRWHADWTHAPDDLPINGTNTRNRAAVRNLGFIWAERRDYLPNSLASVPRPSSNHPGAVIAAFADGRVEPINDDIDISGWLKLVNPE